MVLLVMMLLWVAGVGECGGGVEEGLLRVLGLQRRPPPAPDRPHIPRAMMELYKRQTGLAIDTTALPLPGSLVRSANTARSFTHIEPEARSGRRRRDDRVRLVFNVSLPEGEKVTGAELRVGGSGGRGRVLVHDIVRPGARGKHPPLLRLIDTKEVAGGGDTVGLDVLPAVERWSKEPGQNHGLLVETTGAVRVERAAPEPPLLMVFADDGRQRAPDLASILSRPRRAAGGQPKKRWKEGREHCRRHPLFVDFEEVGWNDWIVAPPGYDAYFCHGDCPFPLSDHMNATNHAVVQNLVHNVNRAAVPKACCVPTQLSSISMLYLDEGGKVVLKTYQDMAVLGCGCR